MKKNIIPRQSPRQASKASQQPITIGMDLGDKTSRYCVLDQQREMAGKKAMTQTFGARARGRIAVEVARTRRG